MARPLHWMTLAFGLTAFAIGPARTAVAQPAKPDIAANLIIGNADSQDPQSAWIGVRVSLGSGWKTYWKSPGDAGLPPEFDWSGSSNLQAADVSWPLPHRTSILGIESVGYSGAVVFPVKIRRRDAALETAIDLKLTVYACGNICVREEFNLTGTIHPGLHPRTGQHAITAWRAKVPQEMSATLSITSVSRLDTNPARLKITASSTKPFSRPDVLIDADPPILADRPEVSFDRDGAATLTVALPGQTVASLDRKALIAILVDGDESVLAVAPAPLASAAAVGPPAGTGPATPFGLPLLTIIATALLGGLTLNLMPCVFPVLSLKLLGFIQSDPNDRNRVRRGFSAAAAGMIASFLVLAAALSAMKLAGVSLGWGIQFQQPLFLAAMALVLTLFAASMLDLFRLALPSRWTNALADRAAGPSTGSQFLAGFVATLLATPCSAPFVGTAVGFALARGTAEIFMIFGALGVGMASPYLVVVAFPSTAKFIPRPGRWLLRVKQVMAGALLLTAAWLLTVLSNVAGAETAIGLFAALALGLMALRLAQGFSKPVMAMGLGVAGLAALAIVGPIPLHLKTDGGDVRWRVFSQQQVDSLVRSGRTVFVDITADWCVTCKVNKALVIDTADIEQRLGSDVVPVQGDWTRANENIARFMREHGRYGIPFNIVFGPNAPDGIALPELLTKSAVTAAFDKAGGESTEQPNQQETTK